MEPDEVAGKPTEDVRHFVKIIQDLVSRRLDVCTCRDSEDFAYCDAFVDERARFEVPIQRAVPHGNGSVCVGVLLRNVGQGVLLDAATVYSNVLANQSLVEAQRANVAFLRETQSITQKRLNAGDVIVEVNGEKIEDSRDLARKVAELHPDTPVKLSIVRYGEKREVTPSSAASAGPSSRG